MEKFSVLLALCEENPLVTGGFPSQSPLTRSFDFSLICAWTKDWANNQDAGDLRCHRTHYDVTVMQSCYNFSITMNKLCNRVWYTCPHHHAITKITVVYCQNQIKKWSLTCHCFVKVFLYYLLIQLIKGHSCMWTGLGPVLLLFYYKCSSTWQCQAFNKQLNCTYFFLKICS